MDNFLTVKEVAELLGVSKITIRRWADRGFLSPLRTPGGHRRFLKDEVLKLYQRNQFLIEMTKETKELFGGSD